jgi:hypothetical protein
MTHDPVNHPDHYRAGSIEVIDVIEAFGLGFRLGNAVKYILRAGRKGDRIEDLKKARWYLDREIASAEAGAKEPRVAKPRPGSSSAGLLGKPWGKPRHD